MDIATISTAVSSVKTAIEIAKLLQTSADTFAKAEIKLKLADLISSLAEVKIQMAEIQEALLESEAEKKILKDKLVLQAKIQFEMPYYWKIEEEAKRDGPFCQLCYDKEKKLIRLQNRKNGEWSCLSCAGYFRDNDYEKPPKVSLSHRRSSWNI